MEITEKCSNIGGIMAIKSQEGRFSLYWNGGMGLMMKIEAPELGTSRFSPNTEDDRVILGKSETNVFLKRMRQLWSHNLPMLIRFSWKLGIMWPLLIVRSGRSRSHDVKEA